MDETEIAAETMAIRAILTTVLSEIANLDPSLRSAIKRFNDAADVVSLQPPGSDLAFKALGVIDDVQAASVGD
jgi:hypothetical protein